MRNSEKNNLGGNAARSSIACGGDGYCPGDDFSANIPADAWQRFNGGNGDDEPGKSDGASGPGPDGLNDADDARDDADDESLQPDDGYRVIHHTEK